MVQLQNPRLTPRVGRFSQVENISKFGENESIDLATDPEDVWPGGGLYPFLSSAATLYISSSSGSDTEPITLEGLDDLWDAQTKTTTLIGQSQTPIAGTWIRANRAYSVDGTPLVGTVYIAESDTLTGGVPDTPSKIKAIIPIGHEQTEQVVFSSPRNTRAYLTDWFATVLITGNKSAKMLMMQRPFGSVFRAVQGIGLNNGGTSVWQWSWPTSANPDGYPGKTDFLIRAQEVTANDTNVAGGFEISCIPDV